ncbi:xanthine dehydrogenase family protein molybdopterin-binding subunit [Chloroflexota bacterium]
MTGQYRYIGKAVPRKDSREIVTGKAKFIDDIKLPGMLFGKVLRSPHAHANIKNIDTSKANAYPGVKAILTYRNVPDWMSGTPRHRRILDSKVRFVGDGVALVAAETRESANAALDLIEVEYELLPAVYDADLAMSPGATQLYDEFPGNIFPRGCKAIGPGALQELVIGDVQKGFDEADYVAEGTCDYSGLPNPLPPEAPGVIAEWEDSNKLTIYIASQSAVMNKNVGQLFMRGADVRVIGTYCGGSYGTKNTTMIVLGYAAALSKVTGRPVKFCFNKEEHFNTCTLRLGSRIRARIGIKKDGTVTAVDGEWLINTGASSEMTQAQVAVGCGEAQLLLRSANWNLQPVVVCTNRNPSGVVRGFGGQELKSALIPVAMQAVEQAGIDPVEFLKKNFVKREDGYYWREGKRWVSRGIDYSSAMDKGAEVFDWKSKWKGWGIPTAVNGTKHRGVGVGVHGNADIGEDESEAYVRLNSDGTVVLHVNVSESGIGQRNNLCKIAAEVLDVQFEKVSMTPPDTLVNPFEHGLVGSRGTYAVGSAVIQATEEARKKLFELAAQHLNAKPEDLETKDGLIYLKDKPEKQISWGRVMGLSRTCIGQGHFEPDFSLANFMAIFTEVDVDVETGKTDLLRVVAATDCGQIIDPFILEGQLHGALGSAGIDTAIFEESVLDKNIGRIMNCNLIDYKWRTYLDLPQFDNVILETPVPSHRFHAIGVGEITTAPGPSAVFMAVHNAIGNKITDYPLTAGKILKALGKI